MEFVFFFPLFLLCLAKSATMADKTKRILVDDNFYTLVAKLNSLEQDVASLKNQSGDIKELRNMVAKQNNTINRLQSSQARHSHETVAFMAYLTKTITGTNHHIYFDDVKLNLGNCYNPHHGMFVAPVNGTYQFTVTACSGGGHIAVLELTVNSTNLGKVLAGDQNYSECSSKVFLAQLQTGDDVFVQHVNQGDYLLALNVYGYPSFTGVLLQAN